ncbi:MAG: PP2C family protein-serine/threonine phosphatase, partial [Candidatus Krumholzibacteriia bacterium]
RIVYCNAGHNPAALVREGRVEWLRAGGLMLGPFPDQVYEAVAVQVQPGDLVCLYTDGITEAVGPMGEQFGEERLAELLCSNCKLAPKQLQETIIERIRDWQGEGEAGDDVTLVLLRVKQRPDAALEV